MQVDQQEGVIAQKTNTKSKEQVGDGRSNRIIDQIEHGLEEGACD